eukprot:4357944-Ditylum_brightwellii.AAC.1
MDGVFDIKLPAFFNVMDSADKADDTLVMETATRNCGSQKKMRRIGNEEGNRMITNKSQMKDLKMREGETLSVTNTQSTDPSGMEMCGCLQDDT